MSARQESWFQRAEGRRAGVAAAGGAVLFSVSWALVHASVFTRHEIVDTPVYAGYGRALVRGAVPYRDFALEYPPAAVPVFAVPALGSTGSYRPIFELLMLACGLASVALVTATLSAVGASAARVVGANAFVAVAPLLLGPVVLTRYDLWPAALTAGALSALVADRARISLGCLAVAAAAKVYPLVLLPLALAHVAARRGRREALVALGVFAAVLAAIVLPFLVLAPDGLARSARVQAERPLQIESLGAAFLLAAHQLGGYTPAVVSSFGSQNLAGALPDTLAAAETVAAAFALVAVWAWFAARGAGDGERLLIASAAAVVAFVAFGKVLSPQFLVWLVPLLALVGGAIGVAAGGVLGAALVATHAWFPSRYWDVVALRPVGWVVLVRDLLLVALFALLFVRLTRPRPGSPRTA